MAGLEPARAFNGPTDFKSVASTIPPHRHRLIFRRLSHIEGSALDSVLLIVLH
jgi:hypothetical protein